MRLLRIAIGNRDIRRLEAGWAVAALGTWTFSITLALYAYYEHGPTGVAIAVAVRMLPAALVAPFAASIADRSGPRAAIVTSALVRFAAVEAIALLVSSDGPFALLLLLAAALEVAGVVHRAARAALVVDLARSPAELGVLQVGRGVDYVGFLAGALLAGVLTSATTLDTSFAVAGGAFALVAGLGWVLPTGRVAVGDSRTRMGSALADTLRHPRMRAQVGLFGAGVLVESMLELLLVVAALDMLGMGDGGVGWLRAAFATGALVGVAVAVRRLGHGRLAIGLAAGLALAGIPLALVAAWPQAAVAVVLLIALGGGYAVLESALLLLSQRLVPADVLARGARVEEVVYPLARALGATLAAWLVLGAGSRAALVVAGLLPPALALLSIGSLSRAERRVSVPDGALRLLAGVPALAALPRATLENLALCARTERFGAGEPIAVPGGGEGLFVVQSGAAERTVDGARSQQLGPGDWFGEEALVGRRGLGGTAAVTAVTDVTALSIARAQFVGCLSPTARGAWPARVEPAGDVLAGAAMAG